MSAHALLAALRAVSVRAAPRLILDRVDMDVYSGHIITVIGPNGAGKTTLLRALLGLLTVESGEVYRRARLRVGYMPQRVGIDEAIPLTVRRFLNLNARASVRQLREALVEVGAAHIEREPIQRISGGEMQRVLLARALLREPELLVLDEPAQAVDVAGRGELYRLIARIRDERGCGVLLVSHDLHLVMEAADSIICLNQHVCCTGHPEAVSRHPEYLKLFGDTGAPGLAVYTHHHDHQHDLRGNILPEPDITPQPKHHGNANG
ncbi:MAG: zinc ABC transporter ATP-binding protein ZnuC [Gammaproteobacteria bacterium]